MIATLEAPPVVQTGPIDNVRVVITRKKRGERPPNQDDLIAWKKYGDHEPQLVYRSPFDPNDWMTYGERLHVISTLIEQGFHFSSRKGYQPVFHPYNGQQGWVKRPNAVGRRQDMFIEGMWIPCESATEYSRSTDEL